MRSVLRRGSKWYGDRHGTRRGAQGPKAVSPIWFHTNYGQISRLPSDFFFYYIQERPYVCVVLRLFIGIFLGFFRRVNAYV